MNPGPLIRQHRLSMGVSQAEIARLLGCHRSRYNRLEAGKLRWKWEDTVRVCQFLEMDINLLVERTKNNETIT